MSTSQLNKNNHKNIEMYEINTDNGQEWQTLHAKLALFDFHTPLPSKREHICRLFYNNCNGISINNTINAHLKQKRQKNKITIYKGHRSVYKVTWSY